MMGQIFHNAKLVVVWLNLDDTVPQESIEKAFFRIQQAAKDAVPLGTSGSFLPAHPYWTRVWTVQEVALARRCAIYAGGVGPLDLTTLKTALSRDPSALTGQWSMAISHLSLFCPDDVVMDYYLPSVRSIGNLDRKERDALLLIHSSCTKSATDPRDLLYALRAVFPAALRALKIDYDQTIAEVFVRATRLLAEHHTLEDILFLASTPGRRVTGIPSWVPDWGSLRDRAPSEMKAFASAWAADYRVDDGYDVEYKFGDDTPKISLSTLMWDTVSERISQPFYLDDDVETRFATVEWLENHM
ncbi:hypothetical protein OQA88_5636 [Cercophora sp. LCS_1]